VIYERAGSEDYESLRSSVEMTDPRLDPKTHLRNHGHASNWTIKQEAIRVNNFPVPNKHPTLQHPTLQWGSWLGGRGDPKP